MALDDFFATHTTSDIIDLAVAVERGDLDERRVDALREAIEETERTLIEDALAERDPLATEAWNRLQGALGLSGIEPPGALPAVEIEEIPEEEVDALERVRDIMFAGPQRFTEEQLRDTKLAIEGNQLGAAPPALRGPLRRLDEGGLEQILEEIDAAIDELMGGLIGEAEEGERGRMRAFSGIQERTDRGPGRQLSYFRRILRELRGEVPADRLPADELQRLQNQRATRQQFIEKVEQIIAQLEAQQAGGSFGGGVGAGGFSGQIGPSAAARRIVPPARRRDPTTGEEWTASEAQIELERNFMEFVLQVKPNRTRWAKGVEFRKQPGNRVREMDEWAWLMVKSGSVSRREAVRKGLPAEWFEGIDD